MLFSQIPHQYAPLGGELRYAVGQQTAGNIDIRIVDAAAGSLLGAKRFAAVVEVAFDAAPYLRRQLFFTPSTGQTGFYAAEGRSVTVVVEALKTGEQEAEVTAPARTFLSGNGPRTPGLRTAMPRVRLIPEGACDELTLLTSGVCTATVTAQTADATIAESYHRIEAGLCLFRLDTRDFPGAESITVDIGAYGTVAYTVTPTRQGSARLAWRSSAGSIEHYTFPVVQTTTRSTERQEAEGPDGRIVVTSTSDWVTTLVSAYESRPILNALAEVTASPRVWIVEESGYTPVDVATREVVIHRHGTLCCLEIAICPKRKIHTRWN